VAALWSSRAVRANVRARQDLVSNNTARPQQTMDLVRVERLRERHGVAGAAASRRGCP